MYEVYRQLSSGLGLRLSPADPGMMTPVVKLAGELDGHPVELRRYVGRGKWIQVTASLLRHLDLGFGIGPSGALAKLAEWLGARDIQVGDPRFDTAFEIRGDEAERVVALLKPALLAELGALEFGDFTLTDAEFSSALSVDLESVPTLERALREAVRVARAVDQARLALPPAQALAAHHAAWTALSRTQGWYAESTPLAMRGRVGAAELSARAVRTAARRHLLELELWTSRPLPVGLTIGPRRGWLDRLGTVEPSPSGDAAFDATFDTRTEAPKLLEMILDVNTRARLMSLQAHGTAFVHDRAVGLHAESTALGPERVASVIDELRLISEALWQNAVAPRAAYR